MSDKTFYTIVNTIQLILGTVIAIGILILLFKGVYEGGFNSGWGI